MTAPQGLRAEIAAALKECDAWIGYNVNGIKDTVAHIQIFHTRDALRAALTRLDHLEQGVIYAKRLLLQCDPDAALEELQSLTEKT